MLSCKHSEEMTVKMLFMLGMIWFMLLPNIASAQEEQKNLMLQAWDFSDTSLGAAPGDSCAALMAYLQNSERYVLVGVAGIAGPPGVVYTLQGKDDIAILKCGTMGAHGDEGDEGGCGGGSGGGSGGGGGCDG